MKRIQWTALLAAIAAIVVTLPQGASAQQDDEEEVAPVRFGLVAGANFNSVGLGGQAAASFPQGNAVVTDELSDGQGWGPYGGLILEYNPAPRVLGIQTRFTYDDRRANLEGPGDSVDATISYIAIEPAARFNLGNPQFHFNVGTGVHLLVGNDFDYVSNGVQGPQDIENGRLNDMAISLWGGFGYDIPISDMSDGGNQWYLTPFVEGSWLLNQLKSNVGDNLDDTWSTVTARAGVQLKYGVGGPEAEPIADIPPPSGNVDMLVATPVGGVMAQRPMIEYFPVLPYVFYEATATDMPDRYTTMTPTQAASFEESSLTAMDSPSAGDPDASTRSQRQLDVYYNVVNILADRLEKNRSTNIEVVGSGPDVAAATARAEKVKNYLINTFKIPADRISSRGQKEPVHKSGTPGTPAKDRPLVEEENIRVEILSEGNEDLFRPVKIDVLQDMPIENDMAVTVNATKQMSRWTMRVQGNGFDREFGPFYGNTAYVNATPILGDRAKGTYTASVNAVATDGEVMTTSTKFDLEKTTLEPITSTRYSMIFRYDDSESLERFSTFLRNTVATNIPDGSIVYIHGHTDVVGLDEYNYNLSVKRAEEAEKILSDELKAQGKNDVTFESYGFGETVYRAPFSNDMPETRHYNRTVMIEIIPDAE